MTEEAIEQQRSVGGAGSRAAAWIAWSFAGLATAMFVASAVLSAFVRPLGAPASQSTTGLVVDSLIGACFLVFSFVGALIVSRRPRNAIGWICLADGLLWMFLFLIPLYTAYGLAHPGSIPFPVTLNALTGWLWVPAVGITGIFLVLLFPDGTLPSRRWRPLAWLAGTAMVVESIAILFTPGRLVELGGMRNPFGLEDQPWIEVVGLIVLLLLPACMLAAAVSLVLRYRRSGDEVRQQIKWLAFAASLVGVMFLGIMVGGLIDWLVFGNTGEPGEESLWGAIEDVMVLSFLGIPVAIGFAVLKYRLYDIEVIINRTLVYGSLTTILVVVYGGSVVSLQYAFRYLTGQESQLVVVASTLLIAALFNPLRRRIQAFIDRRFYRQKYDAQRTLETFAAGLRDETDLEALGEEMVGVVRDTVQPAHVSLWLRPEGGPRSTSL